jgi:NAD(P)-dependent dehydrogenase (short-subunit alcohol dehydrogenase family)
MTLDGKIAIVSGGNRGIGRAIALRLAREGAGVVVAARDEGLLNSAVKEIEAFGSRGLAVACDLRLPESAAKVVDAAVGKFGRLDILVNNAGATKRGDFLALTDDDFLDGFALKYFGAVRLTRAAWPHLKKSSGAMVNIVGAGGRTPGAQFTIGGSVNAAMLSFSKAMADLGIRDGVQVNAINPGPVRTARFETRLKATAAEHGVDLKEAEAIFCREQDIARVGEPEDIAALVAFLLSPNGRLLQGSMIDADGGGTKTL